MQIVQSAMTFIYMQRGETVQQAHGHTTEMKSLFMFQPLKNRAQKISFFIAQRNVYSSIWQ